MTPRMSPGMLSICATLLLGLGACSTSKLPPQQGVREAVDLPRFMGDWYVQAAIPIHLPPLFSEKGAHNGIESYQLADDGTIETTYVFRRGGFDGPEKRFTPRARVVNAPINSEWKMKFFWYLPAGDFLILHVDPDYRHTVIGVPDRSYVWIMSRVPDISEAEYQRLVQFVADSGHDMTKLERVPQRWPAP